MGDFVRVMTMHGGLWRQLTGIYVGQMATPRDFALGVFVTSGFIVEFIHDPGQPWYLDDAMHLYDTISFEVLSCAASAFG